MTTLAIKNTAEYKELSIEETLKILDATTDGLTEREAEKRTAIFGFNEVVEKKKNPILDFLSRYWGVMPWLLELATILSYILKHYLEAAIIFFTSDYKRNYRLCTGSRLATSTGNAEEAFGCRSQGTA